LRQERVARCRPDSRARRATVFRRRFFREVSSPFLRHASGNLTCLPTPWSRTDRAVMKSFTRTTQHVRLNNTPIGVRSKLLWHLVSRERGPRACPHPDRSVRV
jgi:hypothetical protein